MPWTREENRIGFKSESHCVYIFRLSSDHASSNPETGLMDLLVFSLQHTAVSQATRMYRLAAQWYSQILHRKAAMSETIRLERTDLINNWTDCCSLVGLATSHTSSKHNVSSIIYSKQIFIQVLRCTHLLHFLDKAVGFASQIHRCLTKDFLVMIYGLPSNSYHLNSLALPLQCRNRWQ